MNKLLFFCCISIATLSVAQTKSKSKNSSKESRFAIEIQGMVLDNCGKSTDLVFGDFHGTDTEVQKLRSDAAGTFRAKYWIKEPGLFFFRKGSSTQYFLVTPKEKVYKLGLSCSNNALDVLQVFNSSENKAYQEFVVLRKRLISEFENYRGKNLNDTVVFKEFSLKIRDYQKETAFLAKKYQNTYTANKLIVADRINEANLTSIEALRNGYLKRVAFADPRFYNTQLPSYILADYLDFIVGKTDGSFSVFEGLLNTASKNVTSSERLQEILFEAINKSKRQDLMRAYILWGKQQPGKIVNEITKFKMDGLAKSMVDAQFINISLKDTLGVTRELKDAVLSSKYTLVAIYNPDCSHCIETLPKLIPVWETYQSKGLKIFTVAAKNENSLWIDFIKKYTGKGWINVMEDQTNSSFGKYSISSLPSFVLIDEKGKIVSRMVASDVLIELQKWLSKL